MIETSEERIMPFLALQYSAVTDTIVGRVPSTFFFSTDYANNANFPPEHITVIIMNDYVFEGTASYKFTWKGPSKVKNSKIHVSSWQLRGQNITISAKQLI